MAGSGLISPTKVLKQGTGQRVWRSGIGDRWEADYHFPIADVEKSISIFDIPAYYPTTGSLEHSGTATSGTNTTLTQTGAGWGVNAHQNRYAYIASGTGAGQMRKITSNTATVLTVPNWTTNPDATSVYTIRETGTLSSRLARVETIPHRDSEIYFTLRAFWEPDEVGYGVLRDNPDWGVLTTTFTTERQLLKYDKSDTPVAIYLDDTETAGGKEIAVRYRPVKGDGKQLKSWMGAELRVAQKKGTAPTLQQLKALVGKINDATSIAKLLNADEGELLLLGAKVRYIFDPDALNLLSYYFLHEPLGWNNVTKSHKYIMRAIKYDLLKQDKTDSGIKREVVIWMPDGAELDTKLYDSANMTPLNALVKWYS